MDSALGGERINRNVSELSQKLLEGCKLLADSCPETNVPLVSTPDGRLFSVGNHCYYVRDGSELRKLSAGDAASPPSVGRGAAANGTAVHAEPAFPSPAWDSGSSSAAVPPPTGDADAASLSQLVAQKLLDGFSLLSESCAVTNVPLVQDPHGRILSVGTGKMYERVGSELRELPPSPTPPGSARAAPAASPFTAALGALGGGVPMPAATLPPDPLAPIASSPLVPKPTPVAAPTSPPAVQYSPPPVPAARVAAPALPASAAADIDAVSPPAPLRLSIDATLAVLAAQLDAARAELARAAGGPQVVTPHVTLVKEIAEAIAALRAL